MDRNVMHPTTYFCRILVNLSVQYQMTEMVDLNIVRNQVFFMANELFKFIYL
jgi:hypothetical protein